jgi:hypothetical protein
VVGASEASTCRSDTLGMRRYRESHKKVTNGGLERSNVVSEGSGLDRSRCRIFNQSVKWFRLRNEQPFYVFENKKQVIFYNIATFISIPSVA